MHVLPSGVRGCRRAATKLIYQLNSLLAARASSATLGRSKWPLALGRSKWPLEPPLGFAGALEMIWLLKPVLGRKGARDGCSIPSRAQRRSKWPLEPPRSRRGAQNHCSEKLSPCAFSLNRFALLIFSSCTDMHRFALVSTSIKRCRKYVFENLR